MIRKPIVPAPPRESQYGVDPSLVLKRMADLPGMTSVLVKDLFPDLPDVIYPRPDSSDEQEKDIIRDSTRKSLESIDMSMITSEVL